MPFICQLCLLCGWKRLVSRPTHKILPCYTYFNRLLRVRLPLIRDIILISCIAVTFIIHTSLSFKIKPHLLILMSCMLIFTNTPPEMSRSIWFRNTVCATTMWCDRSTWRIWRSVTHARSRSSTIKHGRMMRWTVRRGRFCNFDGACALCIFRLAIGPTGAEAFVIEVSYLRVTVVFLATNG